MKTIRSWCILCICLLLCTGCKNHANTLNYQDLDVSSVQTVSLQSGMTGEEIQLTDPADIQQITDLVRQIQGTDPKSSQGYYGFRYTIRFYDEKEQLFWYGSVCPENDFLSMEIYETVDGSPYLTLYQLTGISEEEICAVCEKYFEGEENVT